MERTLVTLDAAAELSSSTDEGRPAFAFDLHRVEINLAGRRFLHHWIAKPGLYGDRNRRSANRRAVLEYYWARCVRDGSAYDDPEALQSYVLAHLTAHSRSHGSRRVFLDACLRDGIRADGRNPESRQAMLEAALRNARSDRVSVLEFYERTRAVLGRREYPEEARETYNDLQQRLFPWQNDARNPAAETAISIASEVWERDLRVIGRRRGNELHKLVLDMLAYEARAAVHRAYSASWNEIAMALRDRGDLDDFGASFHAFWHLDLVLRSNTGPLHLFHGTPIALHPVSGYFLETGTGARLTRELLERPMDSRRERFLNGLLTAVFDYASRHADANASRRRV